VKLFLYDTETTGLGPRDEVIQIAGILTDINLKPLYAVNRYCFSTVPIDPGAFNSHGITRTDLLKLSGGRFLEDVDDEIKFLREEKDLVCISYNHDFDGRLMNQTMTNNGLDKFDFGTKIATLKRNLTAGRYNLCAMHLFTQVLNAGRKYDLKQLAKTRSGYDEVTLFALYTEFAKRLSFTVDESRKYHDALFDVFLIWVLLSKYKGMVYT
jgi:DNA polymerase III epsilon subunit-like protein